MKKIEEIPIQDVARMQMHNKKETIKKSLGDDLYTQIYELMTTEIHAGTDDRIIYKKIRKLLPGSFSKIPNAVFDLEQVVFLELLRKD